VKKASKVVEADVLEMGGDMGVLKVYYSSKLEKS
jgi:hypothetical protein